MREKRLILAISLVALLAGGLWFHRLQREHAWQGVERALQAIARLKANDIAQWRQDHLAHAATVLESPMFFTAMVDFLEGGEAEAGEDFWAELEVLKKYGYFLNVMVTDPGGEILLSLSGAMGFLYEEAQQALAAAIAERAPQMTEILTDSRHTVPHVMVLVPVFDARGEVALGSLVLVADVDKFLRPLLNAIPLDTWTGETILFWQENDEVVYLRACTKRFMPLSRAVYS